MVHDSPHGSESRATASNPSTPGISEANPGIGAHGPVRLTADLPGIGGEIRRSAEDFLVEELPAYEPTGAGEHIYLFVQKQNLSTSDAAEIIAAHFGVRPDAIGYAGLKDKRAVARQHFSVHAPQGDISRADALDRENLSVLWADRHGNKLRRGHLAGNRFSIRVRDVGVEGAPRALRVLRALQAQGVPNAFGDQRFGARGVNHRIGRSLILGEAAHALDELLGLTAEGDDQRADVEMRRLYAQGEYDQAWRAAPKTLRAERAALRALSRGASAEQAIAKVDRLQRRFWISAFQSAIFNDALARRLRDGALGALRRGDLAWKHDNGAVFAVTDEELADPRLQQRADRLEISPSGPLWGPAMVRPAGDVEREETEALDRSGVSVEALARFAASFDRKLGARRPLRAPLFDPDVEAGADDRGPYVRCAFGLPRGAFATAVMDEVMKTPAPGRGGWS